MKKVIALMVVLASALLMLPSPALAGKPQPPPQAGPPIFYTDQADDAYRIVLADDSSMPGVIPAPAMSQPAFDILRVDWAPVPYAKNRRGGGYLTSITVKGAAHADGSYVSFGVFPSNEPGEQCQLYHFLTPGITAFADAFCGVQELGTRRLVGRVQGGIVMAETTASGGTVLSANFDNRTIPPLLQESGRTLHDVSAFTCVQGDEGLGCRPYEVLDKAKSTLEYRI